jgi:hypothetical protein
MASARLLEEARCFCERHGGDDAVLSAYLAESLADGECDVESIEELVTGFLPSFGALPASEREAALVQLLSTAASLAGQATAPAPQQPAPKSEPKAEAPKSDPEAVVSILCELAPELTAPFMSHLLRSRFRGDASACACWLMEAGEEERREAQSAFTEPRRGVSAAAALDVASDESAEETAALRALILSRYDLVQNAAAPHNPVAWGTGKGDEPSRVRYHEGEIATRSGEKYVTTKLTPEWDGGSRGKVKTKGKRGPGFV